MLFECLSLDTFIDFKAEIGMKDKKYFTNIIEGKINIYEK